MEMKVTNSLYPKQPGATIVRQEVNQAGQDVTDSTYPLDLIAQFGGVHGLKRAHWFERHYVGLDTHGITDGDSKRIRDLLDNCVITCLAEYGITAKKRTDGNFEECPVEKVLNRTHQTLRDMLVVKVEDGYSAGKKDTQKLMQKVMGL
jgi:hypothetical protein